MSDIFQKYIQAWLPKDTELLPFYIGIDMVLEDLLPKSEIKDLDDIQPKIIADPLLGYIHLEPLEMAIIDTKLFQRLRKIRQLGLAYLVFPSLNYSRFEHSLGVLGRLNQILNKLIENNHRKDKEDNIKTVIDRYIISIRLAALLHDIGHSLFSHCSERVIEKCNGKEGYPDAKYIQETFGKHFKIYKKIPFAEIFTLSIIGSRRFFEFIEGLSFSNKKEIEKTLRTCSNFIIGLPIENDSDSVFLAQLMSSGLDADKIDYMMREQHYSGIKLEIDLDRILSKLRVFNLKSYELPNQLFYLKSLYNTDSDIKVLGFEKGGQFAFEEFCVARLALHVKIYLHQKVRAAEAQLSGYLESLSHSPVLQQVHNWLRVPESIIEYPEIADQKFSSDGSLFNTFELSTKLKNYFRKIDQRDIVHRAFAFGPINSYSEGCPKDDDNFTEKFDAYFDVYRSNNLKKEVISTAITLCDENEIKLNEKLLDDIIIEIPRLLNIQQGQESLFFERASYLPVRWTIPIDKIIIYFQENRALAYIFCPKEICSIICVASEKVIFDISGKVYSQESHLSKATYLGFQDLKKTLKERGFYNKYPQLNPISEYLKKAVASEKINNIHEKLKGFKSFKDEYITINRITTFVNQFPEDLQDACLCFLDYLNIYSENLLGNEIDKILQKAYNIGGSIGICPLGSATDSGNRLNYNLRPIFEKYKIESLELNDTVVLESEKLIFYDDNINSGLQLINIFAELLSERDKLPLNLQLNENHHRKLISDDARRKFKNMPICIVYIVGFEGIEGIIKSLLSEHLGFIPDNINIKCHEVFSQSSKILSGKDSKFNHAKKKEFRDTLMEIGESLLKNEGKPNDKIQSCKLGYSNAEAMVLFPYNIPTMTITPLWCKGEVNGIPWIPLAERRRRTKDGKYLGED
jgi:HD superfamily phosphohydrolase